MTQWDEEEMNELETWLSMKVFRLDDGDTLPAYWLRQSKQPATQRIAQMGLDIASIPAMSSDCERVFSQCKLMITDREIVLNQTSLKLHSACGCGSLWRKRPWVLGKGGAIGNPHLSCIISLNSFISQRFFF